MNAVGIQAKLNRGGGIAARYLGLPFAVYRPVTANLPLASPSILTLNVDLDPDFQYRGTKPSLYLAPIYGALCDRTLLSVGDYLVGTAGTYFVIAMQSLLPTAVVECNAVFSLIRPGAAQIPSSAYYGGQGGLTDAVLATGFAGSCLQGTKGERTDLSLPGDNRAPWVAILLPLIPGVRVLANDLLLDAHGVRYVVSSTEQTDLGWRLTAVEEVP